MHTIARSPTRGVVLAGLAYVVAAAVLAGPMVNYGHLADAVYEGDARLIVWTLAWNNHALLNGLPLFESNVFYPAAGSLSYNEHLFGAGLFSLPIYALTRNPILAYNVLWLLAWPLNGLAAFAFARRHVRDDLAAFAGGLVYAFSFFRMLHGHGHLAFIWTFWIPLSLVALERWYERPAWTRMAWLVATLALQSLTSWYLAVMVLLADALLLACLVAARAVGRLRADDGVAETDGPDVPGPSQPVWSRSHLVQGLAGAAAFAAATWPFARHYMGMPPADAAEAARYSGDAFAYLVPAGDTWPGHVLISCLRDWLRAHRAFVPRWSWGEGTLYLGFVALAFSLAGVAAALIPAARRRWLRETPAVAAVFATLLAAGAVALSLGPSVPHGASAASGWMPFDWFWRIPGTSGFRAPARFSLLVLVAMSFTTAAGAAVLRRALGRVGVVVVIALVPLMASEWYLVSFPTGKPKPVSIPAVYRYLAGAAPGSVVSLPSRDRGGDWFRDADYLLYSTQHWHPIVNGFGRGEPDGYHSIIGSMRGFAGPNSARRMRELGVRYVVLHADLDPAPLDEALHSPDFRSIASAGRVYLFEVVPGP